VLFSPPARREEKNMKVAKATAAPSAIIEAQVDVRPTTTTTDNKADV